MTQGIHEQIGILAAIEAESHFVQVGRKMFRENLVPRSHDAALQKGECGFNRVGMHVASYAEFVSQAKVHKCHESEPAIDFWGDPAVASVS